MYVEENIEINKYFWANNFSYIWFKLSLFKKILWIQMSDSKQF